MEIISGYEQVVIQEKVKKLIIDGDLRKGRIKPSAKEELKQSCKIIFVNVLIDNGEKYLINLKTLKNNFVYDFNWVTREIKLVGGIRKNAYSTEKLNSR